MSSPEHHSLGAETRITDVHPPEIVGLVPAAGHGSRISPVPCSKELYPVGFQRLGRKFRPKVVCEYLLDAMHLAGVKKAYIVLRKGKWDIPAYLSNLGLAQMDLAFLVLRESESVPFTLDQAFPFIRTTVIAVGFPDIIFHPGDAFVKLLDRQRSTAADIVLGLFPTSDPQKVDMVDIGDSGQVRNILIKPRRTSLSYSWILAVWTPVFTRFMHQYLADIHRRNTSTKKTRRDGELYMGHVINAAINNNLRIETVSFSEGSYLDIGTPEDLLKAIRMVR